jgi:hypothetical protein
MGMKEILVCVDNVMLKNFWVAPLAAFTVVVVVWLFFILEEIN